MKQKRSAEVLRVRRDLAQLLRKVRAIRRAHLTENEAVARVGAALNEAGPVRRFVRFTAMPAVGQSKCNWQARVDRQRLEQFESGSTDSSEPVPVAKVASAWS
jgi:hypothetical protein